MRRRAAQSTWQVAASAVASFTGRAAAKQPPCCPAFRQLSHAYAGHSGRTLSASAFETVRAAGFATTSDFKNSIFNTPPTSLSAPRQLEAPVEAGWLGKALLTLGGYYSTESKLMRGARLQYSSILEQCRNSRFREAVGLPDEFPATHALLTLHVWMLLARLRAEDKEGKRQAQMMYEEFSDDVEMRVRREGVQVRLNKHLQELEKMFYGSSMAYDKALSGKGGPDGDLRSCLLRNVYGGDQACVKHAAVLERYVTREMACLGLTPSQDVLGGQLRFSDLAESPSG